MTGRVRDARGHRHVGGLRQAPCDLGDDRERHWIVAAAVAVAALASAYSAYSASQAQAASQEYQADVAKEQARAAAEAGKIAEENQRDQDRRMIAAAEARAAGSGIEETTGSALLAHMESAANAELNARRINWAASTRAQGFHAERVGYAFAAQQARRQGYVQTGASLLSGAARAYGAYSAGGGGGGDPV